MLSAALICHPASPCHGIDRFDVEIDLIDETRLSLQYTIEGDLSGVRIPNPAAPRRGDRLWEHTCLEAFLRAPGSSGYFEFNFAPSTEWALYGFTGYREGMSLVETLHPNTLAFRSSPHRVELDVLIDGIDELVPVHEYGQLILGISAVIEGTGGECSYWALSHPSEHPDFHHPESFALTLGLSDFTRARTARSYQ